MGFPRGELKLPLKLSNMSTLKLRQFSFRMALWSLIGIYAFIVVFPLLWMFITAIKTPEVVYHVPLIYMPKKPTIQQFRNVLVNWDFPAYIRNSIIIASVTTIICTIVGVLSGYGFNRFNFKLKNVMVFLTIGVRFIPPVALITPIYLLFSKIGLVNTLIALILVNTYQNLPFYIFIMMNFFEDVPRELNEVAQVDGASRFQAFRRVILPLATPGIAASSIICFLLAWNEFLYGLVLTNSSAAKPLSVGIGDAVADMYISWPQLCAGGVIATIPAIIFVTLFQRYIVSGLTRGALKG